jgi:hypothetical protein
MFEHNEIGTSCEVLFNICPCGIRTFIHTSQTLSDGNWLGNRRCKLLTGSSSDVTVRDSGIVTRLLWFWTLCMIPFLFTTHKAWRADSVEHTQLGPVDRASPSLMQDRIHKPCARVRTNNKELNTCTLAAMSMHRFAAVKIRTITAGLRIQCGD